MAYLHSFHAKPEPPIVLKVKIDIQLFKLFLMIYSLACCGTSLENPEIAVPNYVVNIVIIA